jgi:peptidoglycan/LPS O-acetylase OafA/YrhL
MKRLLWLDIAKALAICWIVYFHFFRTYFEHGTLPPLDWSGLAASAISVLGIVWLKISGLALHAVGVFIILSGWTLMQSTMRRAELGSVAWRAWYGARFLRLYPMYWVAHLVYLLSPFVARLEPVDSRIILSLLGLRFVNISTNFYYLNAAWWYFSMLIQFYLIFPLLFWAACRLGPWTFLIIACAVGFFARYVLLVLWPQNGLWVLGGFAICRLPEFALGMSLAMWHSESPARVEWFLLRGAGFVVGLLLYPAALWLYHNAVTHLRRFRYGRLLLSRSRGRCWTNFPIYRSGQGARSCRRLLVRPLSHSPTLCHLAGASHSRATDLDVPFNFYSNVGRTQCVGNPFGKRNHLIRQQTRPEQEKAFRLTPSRSINFYFLTLSSFRFLRRDAYSSSVDSIILSLNASLISTV